MVYADGTQSQGMNWIRKEKRLAIYLRDGMACVYCMAGVEDEGTVLTLDHLKTWESGGKHTTDNLVTACDRCNKARGTRPWQTFAKHVALYINHGVTARMITNGIRKAIGRTVDVAEAKKIMERRSWPDALRFAAKARI